MLIDSHAHIDYENKLDKDKVIATMAEDGLQAICHVGTTIEDSRRAVEIAKAHKNVFAIVGLHPESVGEFSASVVEEIKELAKHEKVVAIGEIGLDYHYRSDNKQEQKEMFEAMLCVAKELDLPVCIHSRDASDDMFEILSKHAPELKRKGVLHCFGDGANYAKRYTDLGFFISFAGNVTFKKYEKEFLKDLPIEKILVETDCPFLAPEPLRGQVNEPKNVNLTAKFLAEFLDMDFEEFSDRVTANTKNVYYKIK